MALTSTCCETLQANFNRLAKWADENDLKLNEDKTVHMTFRRGGRLAAKDKITLNNRTLSIVNSFKYLGITLQSKGNAFIQHVTDRTTLAIKAMYDIKDVTKMSMEAAMKLFHIKIVPIASYGLQIIWDHLGPNSLRLLETVKSTYLKKAAGLSKFAPSRAVYELTREPFLIEELRLTLYLPTTASYNIVLNELQRKKEDLWIDFYTTDAMTSEDWKQPNYELRHLVTRLAVHGFHHRLCETKAFHDPGPECVCERCGMACERYHVFKCKNRGKSLTSFCLDE